MDDQFIDSNFDSVVYNYQDKEVSSLNEYLNETKFIFSTAKVNDTVSERILDEDSNVSSAESSEKITVESISPITSSDVFSKKESFIENSSTKIKNKPLDKGLSTKSVVTISSDQKHDHEKSKQKSLSHEPPLKKICLLSQSKESSGINVSECIEKNKDITKKTQRNDFIEEQIETILTMKRLGLEAPKKYPKENVRPELTSTQELIESQEASQESVGTKFLQQELAAQWGSDEEEEKAFESHHQHFSMLQKLNHHLPDILKLPLSYIE